jgi:hypothetical protein
MRIAIMQPYFFPYWGYFELIKSVNLFVFFDGVQYIKRGWINRNRIRSKDSEFIYITIPILKSNQNTLISDIKIDKKNWKDKLLQTLQHTYKKCNLHPLYKCIESQQEEYLSPLLWNTLSFTMQYLGIHTPMTKSITYEGKSQELIINICKELGAKEYVNLSGGRELYEEKEFAKHDIKLEFMPPTQQFNKLSILDLCLGDGFCG